MRFFFTGLLTVLFSSLCLLASDFPPVAQTVMQKYLDDQSFVEVSPLSATTAPVTIWSGDLGVTNALWFQPDADQLGGLIDSRPQRLRFTLPIGVGLLKTQDSLQLDLVQTKVLSDNFRLTTSAGTEEEFQAAVHYRGIVSGRADTLAAVSIYNDHVVAVVKTPEDGDMVLGPMADAAFAPNNQHILYRTADVTEPQAFSCGTQADPSYHETISQILSEPVPNTLVDKCVEVYFECDYAMYQEKGSSTQQTMNFVTGMYNVVAAIYQNEQITTTINEIKVWTTRDSYSRSSSSEALNQFRGTPHNADLAHLLARGGSNLGGVAWLNGLCGSYGYAYSNIGSSYSQLPTYSWTVGVVTHEMGHNLGSPHTHSCTWPGGALDNCYTTEGNCSPGPAPPSSGGTIMSYCHLTNIGIDLTAGFGPVPGDLIRSRVNAASCLSVCSTGNNDPNAAFTSSKNGLRVAFTDTSSDSDGTITRWAWEFGDGNSSSQQNPSHTYAASGSYQVRLTVTDDDGASDSVTATVSVSDGGNGNVLQNGVPVGGLSAATQQWLMYRIDLPAGARNLTITTSGNDADADLYIRAGAEPTTGTYDCRSITPSSNETCTFSSPNAGTWYVGVYAYSSFGGLTLTASWDEDGACGENAREDDLSDARGDWLYWTVNVDDCVSSMTISINGGSGDADLYVRAGSQPTTRNYDCRPYRNGNNETCTFDNPTPGTWHIGIRAYTAYSGVTLTVEME